MPMDFKLNDIVMLEIDGLMYGCTKCVRLSKCL